MSYCRFIDDDFQSEIYCRLEGIGWITQVATHRIVLTEPLPPPAREDDDAAMAARDAQVRALVKGANHERLTLPHAGDCFTDASSADCLHRLLALRDIGFRVPAHAIARLREECAPQTESLLSPTRDPMSWPRT